MREFYIRVHAVTTLFLTVVAGNQPPVLKIDKEIEVDELETVMLEPDVSDPDGDELYFSSNLGACGRDSNGNLLPDRDRLTRFGAFLRASSLDELPVNMATEWPFV